MILATLSFAAVGNLKLNVFFNCLRTAAAWSLICCTPNHRYFFNSFGEDRAANIKGGDKKFIIPILVILGVILIAVLVILFWPK
jgi:hypothetical protein